MEKIAIITDSCSDIPQEFVEKYDIYVLPMVVICDEGEYKDGINIKVEEVYEKQKTEVLKTASPEGKDILNTFDRIYQNGYTHAIAVLLSSGLSGTVNEVRLLAQSQDHIEVEVIDSLNGSIGYGMITMTLAYYRDKGMSFDSLVQKAKQLVLDTHVYFSIDALEHLKKGGRIGKATAFVGTALKIKPILSFDKINGEIEVPAKVRGSKKLAAKLIELVSKVEEENKDRSFILMVADGAKPEDREDLENQLKEMYPVCKGCIEAKIGAALSCYLGSGLLGAGIQFIDE